MVNVEIDSSQEQVEVVEDEGRQKVEVEVVAGQNGGRGFSTTFPKFSALKK